MWELGTITLPNQAGRGRFRFVPLDMYDQMVARFGLVWLVWEEVYRERGTAGRGGAWHLIERCMPFWKIEGNTLPMLEYVYPSIYIHTYIYQISIKLCLGPGIIPISLLLGLGFLVLQIWFTFGVVYHEIWFFFSFYMTD